MLSNIMRSLIDAFNLLNLSLRGNEVGSLITDNALRPSAKALLTTFCPLIAISEYPTKKRNINDIYCIYIHTRPFIHCKSILSTLKM